MRWIGAAAALLVVVLIVLAVKVTGDDVTPAPATTQGHDRGGLPGPGPVKALGQHPQPHVNLDAAVPQIVEAEPDADSGPFRPLSVSFWDRIDQATRFELPRIAGDCYKSGQDRKAKLKVSYLVAISGGEMTFRNVQIVESTLTDKALETCMVKAIASARIKDEHMPDWVSPDDKPERALIRIEAIRPRD